MQRHADWLEFLATENPIRLFAFSTRATQFHTDATFQPGDYLLFGPETRGLPKQLLDELPTNRRLRIPQQPESRSLNLSNAVAVATYEAWRQLDFY